MVVEIDDKGPALGVDVRDESELTVLPELPKSCGNPDENVEINKTPITIETTIAVRKYPRLWFPLGSKLAHYPFSIGILED